jgi:hypothetical protein
MKATIPTPKLAAITTDGHRMTARHAALTKKLWSKSRGHSGAMNSIVIETHTVLKYHGAALHTSTLEIDCRPDIAG